jgi:hypothetical protein
MSSMEPEFIDAECTVGRYCISSHGNTGLVDEIGSEMNGHGLCTSDVVTGKELICDWCCASDAVQSS